MTIGAVQKPGDPRDLEESPAATEAVTDAETFLAPWPGVLVEMKDFIDLWFLAKGGKRHAGVVRIFISKALVSQAKLQPHVRDFRASIAGIPYCRIELKGTEQAAHRIEIEHRRYSC